ncbi:MAG: metal ABC transporter permease, partial [Oscillospiraceae bacterium]|nr:metal ABC transporter permease [Oscillospiraceae bacterium]
LCAALISVLCFVFGMIASYVFETPSGASIVAVDLIAFGFCSFCGRKG